MNIKCEDVTLYIPKTTQGSFENEPPVLLKFMVTLVQDASLAGVLGVQCDAVFCFACRHFLAQTARAEETFTSTGFSNWKKALGKKGKISKHVVADYHVNAIVAWASFKESEKIGSILKQQSESYKKEILENRHFIKTVGEVLLVTGTQNIAQRGHREDDGSDNAGNLRRILSLVSGHDKVVKKRLEGGPLNAKYTSPEIQNEMLKTLAQMVREQILKEIHASEQFAILVDETKDVRKTEQLALVVRYHHQVQITESYLCFKNADGLDADEVIGLVSGYGLDYRVNLVRQGYDGAAVMSGAVSGVATRIQEVASSAVYVHCYAHRFNLVIVDACKTVKEAASFFALLQQLYVFVSGSNVHQRWLKIQAAMFPGEQPRDLKRLSDTRWACRADACVVVKTRLKAILRLLNRISEDDDGERAVEATGFLAQMDERFAARLVLMSTLLQKSKSLSTMLQQDDVDLSAASNLAAVIIDELQDMRSNDDNFCEIWQKVDGVVNDCRDDLAPTRRRRAPRPSTRLKGYHVLEATGQQEQATPEVDFKINFMFPEMRRRFSDQNCRLMKGIDALTPSSENFLSPENLKALQETYGADQEDLRHELHQVKRLIERKASKEEAVPKSMQGLVNFLEPYQNAFFELYRLSKIAAIIPVTSASCERSFSAMKLIKTYLRNSMGNERLGDLGMLYIERRRTEKLNMDEFVDKFATSHKNRRIKLV
ncbi:zinc finger MYM-type protein 1-like [Patiria miniata]|uniref:Uncharacterized protein n=1 Tax=Patiria miniata TaxID=46514 RepID=A0A914AGV1_PATMI|nr:zinc finger MYM-type protein 1-like [Patiria miniata]